jgi:hypothetical protein
MPAYQGATLIGQAIQGSLILLEMHESTWPEYICWCLGIALSLFGVKFLTAKQDYKLKLQMQKKRQNYKQNFDNVSDRDALETA